MIRLLAICLTLLPICTIAQPKAGTGGRQLKMDFADRRHFDSSYEKVFKGADRTPHTVLIKTEFSMGYKTRITSYMEDDNIFREQTMKFDDRGYLIDVLDYADTTLMMRRSYAVDDKGRIEMERVTIYAAMNGNCCGLARLTLTASLLETSATVQDSMFFSYQYGYDGKGRIVEYSDSSTVDGDLKAEKTSYAYDARGNKTDEVKFDEYPLNGYRFSYKGKEIGSKVTYKYDDQNRLIASTRYFLGASNRTNQAGAYLYTTEETRYNNGQPAGKTICWYFEEANGGAKASCEEEK